MTINEMKKKLQKCLKPERYEHSLRVMEEAVRLAQHYHVNVEQAETAGLLHDCAKHIAANESLTMLEETGVNLDPILRNSPQLLHGILGAIIAREQYGIDDDAIRGAIYWHTTGKAGMTQLEKIIFIADYIESGRTFIGVEEARKAAYQNLNRCMLICTDRTIQYVLQRGQLLHPHTVETRNDALINLNENL